MVGRRVYGECEAANPACENMGRPRRYSTTGRCKRAMSINMSMVRAEE
jgi:hypothetical protein